MARGINQKLKLPLLERILLQETDEDHPMTVAQIIAALEAQGVSAERKSVYADLEALGQLGVDIQSQKGKHTGWFIGARPFELPELKLLVDAVQSCRFITRRKSDALIAKLETLTSRAQARQLQRQVYVERRVKTMNESVYYNIDKLHTAIARDRAVRFRYFEYNVKKEKVLRREGAYYEVSPWGLIWDSENYYLAGFDHLHREMRHYRVDKMTALDLTVLPRQGADAGGTFDMASYAKKHFGMFSGREGQVKLRCQERLVGVVLDRFGQDTILVPDGEDHFTVTVAAVVSPQFMGWLFGLGDSVELVGPAWAAEAFRRQLRAVAERYPQDGAGT